jgi:Anti-sigma factor NepR
MMPVGQQQVETTASRRVEMAGAEKKFPGARADSSPVLGGGDAGKTGSSARKMGKDDRRNAAGVDRWFDRQLNQLYSDVISEPLPKEFLDLIEKLREKTPK